MTVSDGFRVTWARHSATLSPTSTFASTSRRPSDFDDCPSSPFVKWRKDSESQVLPGAGSGGKSAINRRRVGGVLLVAGVVLLAGVYACSLFFGMEWVSAFLEERKDAIVGAFDDPAPVTLASAVPSPPSPSPFPSFPDAEEELSELGLVHLSLPSVASLRTFASLACTILSTGHQLQVLITNVSTADVLVSDRCSVPYEPVPSTGAQDHQPPDVVFALGDLALPFNSTVIRLEAGEDGAVWDWAGTLSITSLKNFHVPRIDLSVITNDRARSLSRLLTSLSTSHYVGSIAHLSISIERSAPPATHALVSALLWPHGTLTVRHRVVQGGLLPAIVESWYPADDDSYGILLEDDIELSPMFFAWAKWAVLRYRYGVQGKAGSRGLFGVSLYGQKSNELAMEGRRPFDPRAVLQSLGKDPSSPYLSQVPCSWGAVYFPQAWREFHSYLVHRLAITPVSVLVPLRSNSWSRSWKRYFNELVYFRGLAMLYPNFDDFLSLSKNHLEPGEHLKALPGAGSTVNATTASPRLSAALARYERKKEAFFVPLMPGGSSLLSRGMPAAGLPAFDALAVVDLLGFGVQAGMTGVAQAGAARMRELGLDGDECAENDGEGWTWARCLEKLRVEQGLMERWAVWLGRWAVTWGREKS